MKLFKIMIVLAIGVMFSGCATGSGTVLKSSSENTLLGGKVSIGNTIYNISGENSADVLRAIQNPYRL